jgi:hypothetical protein
MNPRSDSVLHSAYFYLKIAGMEYVLKLINGTIRHLGMCIVTVASSLHFYYQNGEPLRDCTIENLSSNFRVDSEIDYFYYQVF